MRFWPEDWRRSSWQWLLRRRQTRIARRLEEEEEEETKRASLQECFRYLNLLVSRASPERATRQFLLKVTMLIYSTIAVKQKVPVYTWRRICRRIFDEDFFLSLSHFLRNSIFHEIFRLMSLFSQFFLIFRRIFVGKFFVMCRWALNSRLNKAPF